MKYLMRVCYKCGSSRPPMRKRLGPHIINKKSGEKEVVGYYHEVCNNKLLIKNAGL